MTGRLLRTREVAELLDVGCETVLRWHRAGKLPGGHRLASNVLRFSESELDAWLAEAREGPGVAEEVAAVPYQSPDPTRSLTGAAVPNRGGSDDAR